MFIVTNSLPLIIELSILPLITALVASILEVVIFPSLDITVVPPPKLALPPTILEPVTVLPLIAVPLIVPPIIVPALTVPVNVP